MTYKVIKDFTAQENPDSITVTPYWVVVVFQQKYPVSYYRSGNKSISPEDGIQVKDKIIITDDCFQLSVSSTKNNYITSLNAGLYPSQKWLKVINPGDWLCAWMVQSKTQFDKLLDKIKSNKACNEFNDGLKFFGKVGAVRKQLRQDPNGVRRVRYILTGAGFSEFDATLYYNPYLAGREDQLATYFGRFGYDINQFIDQKRGGISSEKAIPQIIDVMFGKGTPPELGQQILTSSSGASTDRVYGLEGDYSYVLPTEVATIIGKNTTTKKAGVGYSDVLETVIGVQQYTEADLEIAKRFQPDGAKTAHSRRFTATPELLGAFLPTHIAFANRTVWNILLEFLNRSLNEMYTTLRVNANGQVVPTMVVRQLPFNSNLSFAKVPITKFASLPRWEIDPLLIKEVDIGKTDGMRINFVELLPVSSAAAARNPSATSVSNPPRWDAADIARHGLRPYHQSVPAYPGETRNDSLSQWKDVLQDILMGQHLTMSGQMSCVGIPSPICIGDNVEFEGILYHIESVTHSCGISESGFKSFNTSLTLTHGVNSDVALTDDDIFAYTSDRIELQDRLDPKVDVTR